MKYTQEKINTALGLINLMTNELNSLNTEMALIPSTGPMAEQFQEDRVSAHQEFAKKIIEVANQLGDYFNDLDVSDDDFLSRVNPQFDFINGREVEA